jgi:hypothetical protein
MQCRKMILVIAMYDGQKNKKTPVVFAALLSNFPQALG